MRGTVQAAADSVKVWLFSFWQNPPTGGLCRITLAANLDQQPFYRARAMRSHSDSA
jgi:hypothetical protein